MSWLAVIAPLELPQKSIVILAGIPFLIIKIGKAHYREPGNQGRLVIYSYCCELIAHCIANKPAGCKLAVAVFSPADWYKWRGREVAVCGGGDGRLEGL